MRDNKIINDLLTTRGLKLQNNLGYDTEDEKFECQTNGVISDSIVQNWTQQALDCYKINSNCAICPITKAKYSFKCKMKEVIAILIKTQGLPNEAEIIREDEVA